MWEGCICQGARRPVGVDENTVVPTHEEVPLMARIHSLRRLRGNVVELLLLVRLTSDCGVKLPESLLKSFDNMSLELCEAILNAKHILPTSVFFLELFMEAMIDSTLEDIWIVLSILGRRGIIGGTARAEAFDVFLGICPSLIHGLTCLSCALVQLFLFALDLGMEALESR